MSPKNVLADNPLDAVLGINRAVPEPGSRTPEPAKTGTKSAATADTPPPSARMSLAKTSPTQVPARPTGRELPPAHPEAEKEPSASLRHRIGTIKQPYERVDGTRVRQWSITLPVGLIRQMNHLAIDQGVKPAELAQRAIETFLESVLKHG